jgi:nucleoside-diphosphate-sugar epimerase
MRVLIIGGTKFIGPHVVRQFVDQGHDVLLYHRGQTETELPKGVRHTRSPLASMPVLRFPRELLAQSFDAVVHMIPMGEADSRAATEAFRGRAARVVALSSGDVYRAYGRPTGAEPGPIERGLLHEDSPLRSVLYPYRKQAKSTSDLLYDYEKILWSVRF